MSEAKCQGCAKFKDTVQYRPEFSEYRRLCEVCAKLMLEHGLLAIQQFWAEVPKPDWEWPKTNPGK